MENTEKIASTNKATYFAEIYTIIDAVAEGFGKALVPLHLIKNDKRVRIVEDLNPLDVPSI